MIACTGQDAAARRTRRRRASSGLGSYMSASSPFSLRTVGASGTHCAYPWHRFRSITIRISSTSFDRRNATEHRRLGELAEMTGPEVTNHQDNRESSVINEFG